VAVLCTPLSLVADDRGGRIRRSSMARLQRRRGLLCSSAWRAVASPVRVVLRAFWLDVLFGCMYFLHSWCYNWGKYNLLFLIIHDFDECNT
jgi:hypothetical protein